MVAAPRDKQARRVTKEHIRPRIMESSDKVLAPLIEKGKNTESEIDFANEMQDWTSEAFEVFKEVVNLPPAQIFCAGAPKNKGS
ncbi:hypothetical protein ig2599ANME_2316 [groundwater metagenome]